MPQLVTKQVSTYEYALPLTTPVVIPGLAVNLLTGSGWLRIDALLNLFSDTPNTYQANVFLVIDDVPYDNTGPGFAQARISQYGAQLLPLTLFARLGAGQHTIAVHASCDASGIKIYTTRATLTVTELGF